jgi:hypothetical protein
LKAEKSFDIGQRESALLENESFRVLINRDKGMVLELSQKRGGTWCNAGSPGFAITVWNAGMRAVMGNTGRFLSSSI